MLARRDGHTGAELFGQRLPRQPANASNLQLNTLLIETILFLRKMKSN